MALLVVDVQNDFCPGGALAVPQADKIIPVLNKYIDLFAANKAAIFFSRDWHPPKTKHFKEFGGRWPAHCVQNTKGAGFHPGLKIPKSAVIISKGGNPQEDSYSAFDGANEAGTAFYGLLKILGIAELYAAGLATDYCVKQSVLDSLGRDFKTFLILEASKGVDIKPGDSRKAVSEMLEAGAKLAVFEDIAKKFQS